VLYTPANITVQFRLEITAPDNSKSSETVLALTAGRAGAASASDAAASVPPLQNGSGQSISEPVRVVLVDPPAESKGSVDQSTALLREPPSAPASVPDVPARPTRQPRPVLPASARSLITSQVEVNVKVSINEAGRVTKLESLPGTLPVDESVASAARNAAAAWRFSPARRGGQPVPSELILRFQFRPAATRR